MDKKHIHIALAGGTVHHLEAIAAEYGLLVTSGGHRHGKPSLTQLLEDIASRELVIIKAEG